MATGAARRLFARPGTHIGQLLPPVTKLARYFYPLASAGPAGVLALNEQIMAGQYPGIVKTKLDGVNQIDYLTGKSEKSARDYFFITRGRRPRLRLRSSTSITARRTCPCRCSHSIGSERNICCPQSWRAAKFLIQISEHPTDRFAGLAAIDSLFVSRGDGFGIAVVGVAASSNLPHRATSIACAL